MKKLYCFFSTWVIFSCLKYDFVDAQFDVWEFNNADIPRSLVDGFLFGSQWPQEVQKNFKRDSSMRKGLRSRVWEFREEPLNAVVITHIKGRQLEHERVKYINFNVLPCHTVTYVRVEVENFLSTPYVSYNKHTATVIISYNLLQSSLSNYDIVVKGLSNGDCGTDMFAQDPPSPYDGSDQRDSDF